MMSDAKPLLQVNTRGKGWLAVGFDFSFRLTPFRRRGALRRAQRQYGADPTRSLLCKQCALVHVLRKNAQFSPSSLL